MVVGVATIELRLHGVSSLKEKRSIVRKIVHRTRNEFEISVAEVEGMDLHQSAVIGLALVTNDRRLANSLIDRAFAFVADLHLAEIVRTDFEILNF